MDKIIFGFAGELAAGKGTASKYISEKYQGGYFRFSTMLRDLLDRMYLEQNRKNMQIISTILRQNFSENLFAKVMAEDVKKCNKEIIAIDGVRRLADITYLKPILGFKLVYVEADIQKRYERIILRGENADDKSKTFEQFEKDHQQEAELQIADLKKHADVVLNNSGTFEEFYKQIDELI